MNTLRFSAFSSKNEYNRFMRKVKHNQKQNQPQDDKLHITDCSCGNGHLTINSAETISGYRVVNNGGLIHFVDPNGMPCSKEQFDRIMGETQ